MTRRGTAVLCHLALCALPAHGCAPQDATEAAVALDPTGSFRFPIDGIDHELTFRELAWPAPGEHLLEGKGSSDDLRLFRLDGDHAVPVPGAKLSVRSFDATRVDFDIAWRRDDRDVSFHVDRVPELRRRHPPSVLGAPDPLPESRDEDASTSDDLVLCVIGSPGSGLPGQKRVAASIGAQVGTRRPDEVLVLGDLFLPDGVAARDDRLFVTRFESIYPVDRFAMPFRLVLGAAEHRAEGGAVYDYCATSPRLWTTPGVDVQRERSADVAVTLICCDSRAAAKPIKDPLARRTRTLLAQGLSSAPKGWLIGASYDPLAGHGDAQQSAEAREFARIASPLVERYPVDLWLSGASRSLELVRDGHGMLHVGCGGGAGPEIARPIEWASDTLFAATGGGSVWLRFRGDRCRITFCDCDGHTLFVHEETRKER